MWIASAVHKRDLNESISKDKTAQNSEIQCSSFSPFGSTALPAVWERRKMGRFPLNFLYFLELAFLWMKDFMLLVLPIFVSWSTPCPYRKSNSFYSLSHTGLIQLVSLGELSTQLQTRNLKDSLTCIWVFVSWPAPESFFISGSNTVTLTDPKMVA